MSTSSSRKKKLTFLERSALELSKTSFDATRGPSAHSLERRQKSSPRANRPKKAVKAVSLEGGTGGESAAGARTRSRGAVKLTFGEPAAEWEAYLDLVIGGHVRFLQLDSRIWLAEQYDLENDEKLVRNSEIICC